MAETVMPATRAYIETYGCQMNISDGELIAGILESEGYRLVDRPEDAEVVLVNTCAVREHAEQRVLGRVSQLQLLKRERPELVIGVTGCMAQRMGDALLERVASVDLAMGPDGYRRLPEQLRRLHARADPESVAAAAEADIDGREASVGQRRIRVTALELDPRENYEGLEQRRSSAVTAWVPIQRGCNYRCTFCIVPYVRGSEKNREPGEILREIETVARRGITEVTLLGQTVNSYEHGDWRFPELLHAVARTPGIRRVRFTSPHPNDVTPELVAVMAEEPAVCEHLHLPVQSGNDRVLKRMARRYTVASLREKVAMVRSAIPDIALSTDVIVAFPGETETEYRATLALMRELRFDEAYTYKYSAREGTPATRLPAAEAVSPECAKARLAELITVSRAIRAEINESEIGSVAEVLVEKPARDAGQVLGRTRRNKVVAFPGPLSLIGRYVHVALTGTTGATFRGELAGEPAPSWPQLAASGRGVG